MSLSKSIEQMHRTAQSLFKKELTAEQVEKYKEWLPLMNLDAVKALDDSREWKPGDVFLAKDGKRYLVSERKIEVTPLDDEQ